MTTWYKTSEFGTLPMFCVTRCKACEYVCTVKGTVDVEGSQLPSSTMNTEVASGIVCHGVETVNVDPSVETPETVLI